MTDFDELIGAEPEGAERARLRNVHELLVEAGPPPELTPDIKAGPTLAMTLSRSRRISRRRRSIVLPAVAAALVVALIGIGFSIHSPGNQHASIHMKGTSFAPAASGTIDILSTKAVKPRLKLRVKGLPVRSEPYVVYLVRNDHRVASCGTFTVANASRELTRVLVSPYPLKSADTWIVAAPSGVTVLQPVT
jgi:hypothetical protein